jgi:hypothetical protein
MNEMPDLLAPNPVVDALCAARDEIGRLRDVLEEGAIERDEVMAILRRHIDHHVFGES